jgi:hypothetical protein
MTSAVGGTKVRRATTFQVDGPKAHIFLQLLSRRSHLAITVKSASRPQQSLPKLVIFMTQFGNSGRGQQTLRKNSSIR